MQRPPSPPRPPQRQALRASIFLAALTMSACVELPPTPRPDYAIRVKTENGKTVAVPPPCPSWNTEVTNPFDNQPLPQLGCANARNLASMIERPEDLLEGRDIGSPDAVTSLGAVIRYKNNQTRGLIWTGSDPSTTATTTASTPSSSMTGEAAGSGSGGGASSSSKSGP